MAAKGKLSDPQASENVFAFRPFDLFLALRVELALERLCDIMEKSLKRPTSNNTRALGAQLEVLSALTLGNVTRAELIDKLVATGYSKTYAEKFLSDYLKRIEFHLIQKPESKKGKWGKPDTKGDPGRPKLGLFLGHKGENLDQNLVAGAAVVLFLSGTYLRLLTLIAKLARSNDFAPKMAVEVVNGLMKKGGADAPTLSLDAVKVAVSEAAVEQVRANYEQTLRKIFAEERPITSEGLLSEY